MGKKEEHFLLLMQEIGVKAQFLFFFFLSYFLFLSFSFFLSNWSKGSNFSFFLRLDLASWPTICNPSASA
jgi:hypothetical protein